ncbi:MAG TPA: FRG domain-containing protein [Candidatus Sulfotelmatobacter sp.]|nr:FRG domain-containing protein [Candidatus Sulfotelmatobacter sp.]
MIANDLGGYLHWVQQTREEWHVEDHKELWFRAEDEVHYPTRLQPGLYRPRPGEKRKPTGELLELENHLYNEFDRCLPQLSDLSLRDDEWDPYFLMQHHGAPTRILDWSDSALIALHFAVRDKSTPVGSGSLIYVLDAWWLVDLLKKHPDRRDAKRRWAKYCRQHPCGMDEDDWDRLYLPEEEEDANEPLLATPSSPLLWDAPHVSRRVAAQRSRFLIFGVDPTWLADLGAKRGARISAIKIPADSIGGIKQELRDAGITESVVYPDLDGLGRELRQVWDSKR